MVKADWHHPPIPMYGNPDHGLLSENQHTPGFPPACDASAPLSRRCITSLVESVSCKWMTASITLKKKRSHQPLFHLFIIEKNKNRQKSMFCPARPFLLAPHLEVTHTLLPMVAPSPTVMRPSTVALAYITTLSFTMGWRGRFWLDCLVHQRETLGAEWHPDTVWRGCQ